MMVRILDRTHIIGIPWTCMWIVMFPFLAPSKPAKSAIAALGAASTDLAVVLISQQHGATSSHMPVMFFVRYFIFSTYLCAVIASVAGHGLFKLGKRLGRAQEYGSYRLTKLLGRGGMGEVWLAHHRMLARPSAIKLIRPEVLGADEQTRSSVLRRFRREARATAALRSCHTIDLYDFGTSEDGSFYYVMELLDGLDLRSLVTRFGPIPPGRAVGILRQVCHSLMDAHENGLIHRDIKPANIYVCRLGPDYDFVKVLDFGLVKGDSVLQDGDSQVTKAGAMIGSPAFMAPEMALGKRDIDGRADLYAVGCVGYWLVTGQLVFEGENSVATMVQHVQAVPVPPSQRTELQIPAGLEKIILACLAKEPGDRPQDARELDRQLAARELAEPWTDEMAVAWWELHVPHDEATQDEDGSGDLRLRQRSSETPAGGPS
jgi:serine/threonine-protein kinase